jgi:predicted acetyltransferase
VNIELRQLSIHDGRDIYDMLQELPKEENGFINGCYGKSFEEYKQWLVKSHSTSKGTGLADWMVPQTVYWLYVDGLPVGICKLRHYLTDRLREEGGHCGYAIRPACRSMGYGKLLLKLLIKKACMLGIDRLLITVLNNNTPSIKVALANGGVIEKVSEERHYIWLDCHL